MFFGWAMERHLWCCLMLFVYYDIDSLVDNHRAVLQEMAMLQGCGTHTWKKYNMQNVPNRLMRDFIGNGYRGNISAGVIVFQNHWPFLFLTVIPLSHAMNC